jgi:tripartite-type tricarboxylate transporter receptor subunit TctC
MPVATIVRTAAALLLAAPLATQAQAPSPQASPAGSVWPTRPVRVVVPFPPGGAADNVARVLAQRLTTTLGQQVVIDNRAGASGIIGAEVVARSAPDGYTLLDAAASHSVNPALHKVPFDTVRDFSPVAMLVTIPNLLIVHPSMPVASVQDVLRLARARPGDITYASAGVGSAPHMAGELFRYLTATKLVHVPYKGGGPALADLMGGHVQLGFLSIATSLPHVKAGKVKGIAVTSPKRSRSAPEYPTVAEAGVKGYEIQEWNGLFAPAGVAPEIVARLNAEVVKALATPDVEERLFQLGAEVATGAPGRLGEHLRIELAKWAEVVKAMGIRSE